MYSDNEIELTIDYFLRTWLKARHAVDYQLERRENLWHVEYKHPPMPSDPGRLNEFLVLSGELRNNIDLIHSAIGAQLHWLTVFTPEVDQTRGEYKKLRYRVESDEFLMRLSNLAKHIHASRPNVRVMRLDSLPEAEWLNRSARQVVVHPLQINDPDVAYYYVRSGDIPTCYGRVAKIGSGIIGPDKIQTHPDYRRQGLAFELLNTMHRDALEPGCTESVLLSSVEGHGLYNKLGYEDVSAAVVFASAIAPNNLI